MKHRSLMRSFHTGIIVLLVLNIIQTFLLIHLFNSDAETAEILNDAKNISFSFLIVFVVVYVAFISYLPMKLKKSLKLLIHIFQEFTKGNYNYDMIHAKESVDNEYDDMLISLEKMQENIIKFDKLKETKIYSHHSKLKSMLSLVDDGIIILDKSGEILYANEVLVNGLRQQNIEEYTNILDSHYTDSFESGIKKYIYEVLTTQTKKAPCSFYMDEIDGEILVKCSLFKDKIGDYQGAIFLIKGLKTNNGNVNKDKIKEIV